MFLTKKSLPRRTILRGLGAAVALPLFDAMLPAFVPLAKAAAKPRMRSLQMPNRQIVGRLRRPVGGQRFRLVRFRFCPLFFVLCLVRLGGSVLALVAAGPIILV